MKNLMLNHLLFGLMLLVMLSCKGKNDISPNESQLTNADFLPQIPYCECEKIIVAQPISKNEAKPTKKTWSEFFTLFDYDVEGRLAKETEYISAADVPTRPIKSVTYEYESGFLRRKNFFDIVIQIDSLGELLSAQPSLKIVIDYTYAGDKITQEKHSFLQDQVFGLITYRYDCKGNMIEKKVIKDLYPNYEGKQPAGHFLFKHDCNGNIAKEYQRLEIRDWRSIIYETRLIAYEYENKQLRSKNIYNESQQLIQKELYSYDSENNLIEIRLEDYRDYTTTILERRNYWGGKLIEQILNPNARFPTVTKFQY